MSYYPVSKLIDFERKTIQSQERKKAKFSHIESKVYD